MMTESVRAYPPSSSTLKDYDQTGRMRLHCRPEYIWDLDNLVRKVRNQAAQHPCEQGF